MRKQKYYYNSKTQSYEKAKSTWRWRLLKSLIYVGSVCALAIGLSLIIFNFFETPQEIIANRELGKMEDEYLVMQERVDHIEDLLEQLGERDDNIYRVIFEAEPISEEIRKSGIGGGNQYSDLLRLPKGKLIRNTKLKVDQLEKQLAVQSKSYEELKQLLENKEEMLASIPAIQPMPDVESVYLASGFGMRYHPIYKTRKMHTGIDFSAAEGTEVHVTGNGIVESIQKEKTGYGYHIIVNHDFGYKTLYAHLSEISVRRGERVNRGQTIGLSGNTGTSTAPHLHYEVLLNESKINPVHFFFNDLTPEEYEKIVERAELSNQSFD